MAGECVRVVTRCRPFNTRETQLKSKVSSVSHHIKKRIQRLHCEYKLPFKTIFYGLVDNLSCRSRPSQPYSSTVD